MTSQVAIGWRNRLKQPWTLFASDHMGNTASARVKAAERSRTHSYDTSSDSISILHRSMKEIDARRRRTRVMDNYIVIWLDSSIDEWHGDIKHSLHQLQATVDSVKTMSDLNKCFEFINAVTDERIFLITSGFLGRKILPSVHRLAQVECVYIFCRRPKKHYSWSKKYNKIKGIYTHIEPICQLLQVDTRRYQRGCVPVHIVFPSTSTIATNELDQSFMYSQLLKEVLLEMDYTDQAKAELVRFCREQYSGNDRELLIIDEFELDYGPSSSSVRWYTRECFTYTMLNKALRTQDIEVIMKMGPFIRDLHREIEQLHAEDDRRDPFVVYRGQGVLPDELEKIRNSTGFLMSFSNFLSTSLVESIAVKYARRVQENSNLIAILYRMKIDPTVSSTPFAAIDSISYYAHEEEEILFSMHAVFRIGAVEQVEDRLWLVDLTLTSDRDEELENFGKHIRQEIEGGTGMHRMGALMIEMGQFDKAEEIYSLLLEKTPADDLEGQAILHHQLGYINTEKGELVRAGCHYDRSVTMRMTSEPSDHPQLSVTYSNIGTILQKQGHLDAALKLFQTALKIDSQGNEPDQVRIAVRHNNIGSILKDQRKYEQALASYKRAVDIFSAHLPSCNADLAKIYNNIGVVYDSMGNPTIALSYYERTLEIERRVLPPNHPTLAMTHYQLATVLEELHRKSQAVEHAEQSVRIAGHSFKDRHSQMQIYQNCLTRLLSRLST